MSNQIIVKVVALDYTVSERDVAEALKAHFPNMPTRVEEVCPTPELETARAVLRDLEWIYHANYDEYYCESCNRTKYDGHRADCKLKQLIG